MPRRLTHTHTRTHRRDANAMRVGHTCGMMVVGPPNENDECYIVTIRHKHQAGMMQVGVA